MKTKYFIEETAFENLRDWFILFNAALSNKLLLYKKVTISFILICYLDIELKTQV